MADAVSCFSLIWALANELSISFNKRRMERRGINLSLLSIFLVLSFISFGPLSKAIEAAAAAPLGLPGIATASS
jgi:hypothetical protein